MQRIRWVNIDAHGAICMRTIKIDVSEPVYEEFQRAARRLGPPTSELIREAMENYRREWFTPRRDLSGFRPRSLGRVISTLSADDDLLEELLGGGPGAR